MAHVYLSYSCPSTGNNPAECVTKHSHPALDSGKHNTLVLR